MDFKGIGKKIWTASKPGVRLAAKGVAGDVLVPLVLDPLLDKIAAAIPGTVDDVAIAAFKPKLKQIIVDLMDKI